MRVCILLAALPLGACDGQQMHSPDNMIRGDIVGHWTGQRPSGRARVLWLSHVATDGQLDIEFWTCFNGQRMLWQRQTGTGGLRDGVFETRITRQVFRAKGEEQDTVNDDGFDYDYRVTELTPTRMRYKSEELGQSYEVTRVTNDFALSCPPATVNVDTTPIGPRRQDGWIRRGVEPDVAPAQDDVTAN